ncbi:ATP-dependent DNA ligase [Phanerochaete sordida]|uniref:DNA ligase n=1 Tax=Phanerochaete sordida TaxID=48140 RepID=A0A9P3GC91_9APHY|nr:ATP-dependent DNA ligase [Phanerochaete sordida]
MSKRPLSSSGPSTPRKRKGPSKAPANQPSLDSFFRTRPADTSPREPASSGSTARSGPSGATRASDSAASHDLAADEAFARRLAEEDGIDVHMLARMEAASSRPARPSAPVARTPPEIIDVDLLSDSSEHDDAGTPAARNAPATPVLSPLHLSEASSPPKTEVSGRALSTLTRTLIATEAVDEAATYPPLDIDPVAYSLDECPWRSKSAPYSFLAHALATLSGTKSRIAIMNVLTNTLRAIIRFHPASLRPALYLLSNTLAPPYSPIELGLGPSIMSKAIQDVSGLTSGALRRLYNATGDPGDVAFEAKSNVRTLVPHPPLLITGVYDALLKIAQSKGTGAGKAKQGVVQKLLVAAKGEETRYLVRTLGQNLRVGAVRTSILTALARATVLTPPAAVAPGPSAAYATAALLAEIQPVPAGAKKKPVDPARDDLQGKYARAEAAVKKAYVLHPNYDHIAAALVEVGLDGLAERLPLTVGIPLLPTLGSPVRSLDEVYDLLGSQPFSAEFKYDGQRAQIHAARRSQGTNIVKIFSRHLEDMTDKYPDVTSLAEDIFANSPETESFILDSEIVAIDPADGSLKSFQELSNRARRDVKLDDVKVSVCVFAFDLMYLNGEILLEQPFRQRRTLLRTVFPPMVPERKGAAHFQHVQSCESTDGRDAVEQFWQEAVGSRSEGLMIKLLDSGAVAEEGKEGREGREGKPRRKPLPATYEPDKRTAAWLKLKKDYVAGLGDSLDLVPVGAWHGNGRKAQWWSPILLAAWDPAAGKLVAVCKCMSGFSDAFYKELRARYAEDSETCSRQPQGSYEVVTGGLKPEVYFKPQEVWEIRGADITISPVSVAALGMVSEARGLSLRFPRFIRVRDDKAVADASTPEFLADMYRAQQGRGGGGGVDDGDLVDAEMAEESEVEDAYLSDG